MYAIEVFKCFNIVSQPDYEKFFKCLDHCKGTRENNHSLLLPKVKSEAGRNTLAFLGAKIFTDYYYYYFQNSDEDKQKYFKHYMS